MMTDRIVCWLHISDLHAVSIKTKFPQDLVLSTLVDKVTEIVSRHKIALDAIFFTGDAAEASATGDYRDNCNSTVKVLDRLRSVNKAAGKKQGLRRRRVFVVPGNHDVVRANFPVKAQINQALEHTLRQYDMHAPELEQQSATLKEWLSHSLDSDDWSDFPEVFDCYKLLLQELRLHDVLWQEDEVELARRFIFSRTFRAESGLAVRVDGLNTSWNCFGSSILQKGQIHASIERQLSLLGEHARKQEPADVRIIVQHHPPSWLHVVDTAFLEHYAGQHAQFLLHGHEHMSMQFYDPTRSFVRIAAGCCYTSNQGQSDLEMLRCNIVACCPDRGIVHVCPLEFRAGEAGWVVRSVPGLVDDWFPILTGEEVLHRYARPMAVTNSRLPSLKGRWEATVNFDNGAEWDSCTIRLEPEFGSGYSGTGEGRLRTREFSFDLLDVQISPDRVVTGRWESTVDPHHGLFIGELSESSRKLSGRFITSKRDNHGRFDTGTWNWRQSSPKNTTSVVVRGKTGTRASQSP